MQVSNQVWLPALGLALLASSNSMLSAQSPQLIKDINTTKPSRYGSYPSQYAPITVGTTQLWVFRASSSLYGYELFITDGTAANTKILKDINPGSGSSSPYYMTAYKGEVYFRASDGKNGSELWKTNGTAAGTIMFKDIDPTTYKSGSNTYPNSGSPYNFTIVKTSATASTLFFTAYVRGNPTTPGTGRELWKCDGTVAGTVLVKDLYPGGRVSGTYYYPNSSSPTYLTPLGSKLYFRARDAISGTELFESDGTAANTKIVQDIRPGTLSSYPQQLTTVTNTSGTYLVFSASTASYGYEPWKCDPTATGTTPKCTLIQDIRPGTLSSSPYYFTALGTQVIFRAYDSTNGGELWKYDSTATGTTPKCTLLKDIWAGRSSSYPYNFTTDHQGNLYFTATDRTPVTGTGNELWVTKGTAATTKLVKDIFPGTYTSGTRTYPNNSSPSYLTKATPYVYFRATNGNQKAGQYGYELYLVLPNGTVQMVKDIWPGTGSSYPSNFYNPGGPRLFFAADDGKTGSELWSSTGSAATTKAIVNLRTDPTHSSPYYMSDINGRAFFYASNLNGYEPHVTDGTAAGTKEVKDIDPGSSNGNPNSSSPRYFTDLNGITIFTAYVRGTTSSPGSGTELWRSDGTAAGTTLIKDIYPGGRTSGTYYYPNSSSPYYLTLFKGQVFFRARNATNGYELWRTDGTGAGTVMVADLRPGTSSSYPQNLRPIGDTLYFSASAGSGYELYKTNGTAPGTVLVKDIYPGTGSSSPYYLTEMGGKLYFRARTTTSGYELHVSDGTSLGTAMVADIWPGTPSSSPYYLTAVGNKLFFRATDGNLPTNAGYELWVSGGTSATTKLVKDIFPGTYTRGTRTYPNNSYPYNLAKMGNKLIFSANNGTNGNELWTSDGTAANTKLIHDIRTGTASSSPSYVTVPSNGGRFAWFAANDGTTGTELWRYDPANTTTPVTRYDINPGSGSSYPANYSYKHFWSMYELAGGMMYFRAQRDIMKGANSEGYELWGVKLGASSKTIGYPCGQYYPTITSTDPVLGQTMTVSGTRAGPSKVVVLLGALELGGPTMPGMIGTTGCTLYMNIASPVFLTWVTLSNASGAWSIPIGIPNDQNLNQQKARGQALVTPTTGALGFDLSDALDVVIGK